MSEFKHSKGPWRRSGGDGQRIATGEGGATKENTICNIGCWPIEEEESANADRIIACVNACDRAGLSNEALDGDLIVELLKIAKNSLSHLPCSWDTREWTETVESFRRQVEAAIARANV